MNNISNQSIFTKTPFIILTGVLILLLTVIFGIYSFFQSPIGATILGVKEYLNDNELISDRDNKLIQANSISQKICVDKTDNYKITNIDVPIKVLEKMNDQLIKSGYNKYEVVSAKYDIVRKYVINDDKPIGIRTSDKISVGCNAEVQIIGTILNQNTNKNFQIRFMDLYSGNYQFIYEFHGSKINDNSKIFLNFDLKSLAKITDYNAKISDGVDISRDVKEFQR